MDAEAYPETVYRINDNRLDSDQVVNVVGRRGGTGCPVDSTTWWSVVCKRGVGNLRKRQ